MAGRNPPEQNHYSTPSENYIFLIGGSGARVYRAFLHACAAGVIQTDRAHIMLLDSDTRNAACTQSLSLYETYQVNHAMLHQTRTEWTPAFHCDVRMDFSRGKREAISPVNPEIRYLKEITRANNERDRAMKWFYTQEERDQNLQEGFYAHPNIGCVFFQDFGNDLRMQQCIESIRADLMQRKEVRIILLGSVFGGTGAAGLPSVRKIIEEAIEDGGTFFGKPRYCGILITPYFKITPRLGATPNITINSDEFYSGTRAALQYYRFTNEFEKIYLVGQENLELASPKYHDGGSAQSNKPHIVELIAAIAMEDFMRSRATTPGTALRGNASRDVRTMILSHGNINWDSLQSLAPEFHNLGTMLRTQMLLETEIYPYLDRMNSGDRSAGLYQWYRAFHLDNPERQIHMDDMRQYTRELFEWIYPLQCRYKSDNTLSRNDDIWLFNPDSLKTIYEGLEESQDGGAESTNEKFHGARQFQKAFQVAVRLDQSARDKLDTLKPLVQDVFWIINLLSSFVHPKSALRGIWGMLASLFELSDVSSIEKD